MYLYLYCSGNKEKQNKGGEKEERSSISNRLVRKALQDYCGRLEPGISDFAAEQTVIERDSKGKPYFPAFTSREDGAPAIHFSVSHSGDWWGCMMGAEPVGFDLEVCRNSVNFEKIAQRFFAEDERALVYSGGSEMFFDIWVRKEAYVKYLGTGLAEGLGSFSVAADGALTAQVISKQDVAPRRLSCFIRSCDITVGVKAAYCSGSGAQVSASIILE